jgi:hypothetical protein
MLTINTQELRGILNISYGALKLINHRKTLEKRLNKIGYKLINRDNIKNKAYYTIDYL